MRMMNKILPERSVDIRVVIEFCIYKAEYFSEAMFLAFSSSLRS